MPTLTLGQTGQVVHPDFGNAELNYSVQSMPGDGDGQVQKTIAQMVQYVMADCNSPELVEDAAQAMREGNGDPVLGAFTLARKRIRFQQDNVTGRWGGPGIVEVLVRPVDVSLFARQGVMVPGDCDDFSMYVAALLIVNLVPCCFVTVAADDSDPNAYSHVYVAAYPQGGRKAVDASHGKFCGWEVANRFGKCREWKVASSSAVQFGGGFGGVEWGTIAMLALAGGAVWWYCNKSSFSLMDAVRDMWRDE